jgi:hypothetical protein
MGGACRSSSAMALGPGSLVTLCLTPLIQEQEDTIREREEYIANQDALIGELLGLCWYACLLTPWNISFRITQSKILRLILSILESSHKNSGTYVSHFQIRERGILNLQSVRLSSIREMAQIEEKSRNNVKGLQLQ